MQAAAAPFSVLIIDDDPIVTTIYRRFLEANGFAVDTARDGATGLARLAATRPHAVILDLMLPKVSGLQVLRSIRAHESFRTLPVLVFTAAYVPSLVEEASKAGADRIFDKSNDKPIAVTGYLHDLLGTSVKTAVAVASKSGNPDAFLDYWPAPGNGLEPTAC